jgi:hypothetical protein
VYYIYHDYIFTLDFPWLDLSRDYLLRTVRLPLQNVALIALESYACKLMDLKQLRGKQHQVVIVPFPGSMVGPSGECIWLTVALAWLVVKCKVKARQVKRPSSLLTI